MKLTSKNLVLKNNLLQIPLKDYEVEDMQSILNFLSKGNCVDIEIKQAKPSKSSVAYLWKLCHLVAVKSSQQGNVITKNEVYRSCVRECMDFESLTMKSNIVKNFDKVWRSNGLGYSTEIAEDDGENATVFCYYGSSAYDKKDFSRLLDYVVQECQQLGINP